MISELLSLFFFSFSSIGESRSKRGLFHSRFLEVKEKPEEKELKEDHLMQL